MNWWQEIAAKSVVLVAAILAILGSAALALMLVMANGSAISDLDFSRRFAIFSLAIVMSQVWLSVAGCRSSWRWIDRWSEEVAEACRITD